MTAQVGDRGDQLDASKTVVINPQGELPGSGFLPDKLLRIDSPHQDPPRHPIADPLLLLDTPKTPALQTPHDLALRFLGPPLPGENKGHRLGECQVTSRTKIEVLPDQKINPPSEH